MFGLSRAARLPAAPAAAADAENTLHQLLGLFLFRLRRLRLLALFQARQKHLGARRMEHVDQIFAVDRARSSERNSHLAIVLREGWRRGVAVDLDLEILGE